MQVLKLKTPVVHTHVVEKLDSTNKQNAHSRVHMYTLRQVWSQVYTFLFLQPPRVARFRGGNTNDLMPMDAYEGNSEQAKCDIVATYSSAPSPHDLPPVQLKANLPLLQVKLDQMQADERGQHCDELFVDKDTLSLLARSPSPWHSTLILRNEPSTRALGLRHDVFNRKN